MKLKVCHLGKLSEYIERYGPLSSGATISTTAR